MEQSARAATILWIADTVSTDLRENAEDPDSPGLMFAASLASAVDLLGKNDIDAIVLCLPIVSYSAEELVRRLRASANTAPLFVYDPAGKSGCGDELIRLGAAQYITDTVQSRFKSNR